MNKNLMLDIEKEVTQLYDKLQISGEHFLSNYEIEELHKNQIDALLSDYNENKDNFAKVNI